MWATLLCISKETCTQILLTLNLCKQVFGRPLACFNTWDIKRVKCCPVTFLTLPYAVFFFFSKDHIEYCLQCWHFYDVPIRSEYTSVWDELFLNVDNQCAIHMFISATYALWGGSMYKHYTFISPCEVCLPSAQNLCIHLWHCTVFQMNKDDTKIHWKKKLKNKYSFTNCTAK